jgi:hypothetical protein
MDMIAMTNTMPLAKLPMLFHISINERSIRILRRGYSLSPC